VYVVGWVLIFLGAAWAAVGFVALAIEVVFVALQLLPWPIVAAVALGPAAVLFGGGLAIVVHYDPVRRHVAED
jgi:hypothetical protein